MRGGKPPRPLALKIAPILLEWRGPKQTVTRTCSVVICRKPLGEAPLRFWKDDGSAIALCQACVRKYLG